MGPRSTAALGDVSSLEKNESALHQHDEQHVTSGGMLSQRSGANSSSSRPTRRTSGNVDESTFKYIQEMQSHLNDNCDGTVELEVAQGAANSARTKQKAS